MKQHINKRNKIIVFSHIIMGLLFSILLFVTSETLDNFFLFENKEPNLWATIASIDPIIISSVTGYSKKTESELMQVNLLNEYDWLEGSFNGIVIKREGNKLRISGRSDTSMWLGLTNMPIQLDKGVYVLSVGCNDSDAYFYFEGWNDGENKVICNKLGQDTFSVDRNEFPDGYKLCAFIPEDVVIQNLELTPTLYRVDSYDDIKKTRVIYTKYSDWENLTEKQKRVACSILKYMENDVDSSAYIFDNGLGIQFDGGYKMGYINEFGEVYLVSKLTY